LELVLVRHGESLHNTKSSSSWDSELSITGKEQACLVAQELADEQIDEIWCSPMFRALETAHIISNKLNVLTKTWVNLSEHGYGWDENGLSRSNIQLQYPTIDLPIEIDEDGWARHWRRESITELNIRMKTVVERIHELASKQQTNKLVVVIHGKSGTELLKHILQIPADTNLYFRMCNCAITRIYLNMNNEAATVICMNYITHLNKLADINEVSRSIPRYR
jgi:broad specificity phosphatase PhoE